MLAFHGPPVCVEALAGGVPELRQGRFVWRRPWRVRPIPCVCVWVGVSFGVVVVARVGVGAGPGTGLLVWSVDPTLVHRVRWGARAWPIGRGLGCWPRRSSLPLCGSLPTSHLDDVGKLCLVGILRASVVSSSKSWRLVPQISAMRWAAAGLCARSHFHPRALVRQCINVQGVHGMRASLCGWSVLRRPLGQLQRRPAAPGRTRP